MPLPPQVTCVVLNYNGWQDTFACVHSLLKQDYAALTVVIIDNASDDDSVSRIQAAFPQIDLLQSGSNGGFSAGNNVGIRHALADGADFIWLLNNDAVAPPDTCTKLVAAAQNPNTGIVGTVLYYHHDPAKIQAWGGGTMRRSIGHSKHFVTSVALGHDSFVTFASVLLRREMLEQVGLLDDGYFMYFEDADLCFRARARGWQLAIAGDTAVLHKEGGASAKDRVLSARAPRIVTASGMRFLRRHGSSRVFSPWLYLLTRITRRAIRADFLGIRAVLRGARDFHRNQPRAFQQERGQ